MSTTVPFRKAALSSVTPLLPLIVGQLLALWLVVDADTSFFQIMLMNAAEIWMAILATMLFFSQGEGVFGKRAANLFAFTGGLFVALVFVVFAIIPPARSMGDQPLFRMVDLVKTSVDQAALMHGLLYVATTLGLSLACALKSGTAGRWWYANVVLSVIWAMLAMTLVSFAAIFIGSQFGESASSRFALSVTLLVIFSALRIAFTWLHQRTFDPATMEKGYANFLAGVISDG